MSEVRGRWEGWHVVDEGRVDLAIVSTDPSEPNAVFDAGAEVIIRPAAEDAHGAIRAACETARGGGRRMKIPKRTVALPDSRIEWRLLTEAELADLEARANAKPLVPVEVIARAREVERNLVTLAAVLPGGTEPARVIRDLLTAVEAAPCPHEDAEWCVAVSGNGYWRWGPQGDRRCRDAETICPDCGELLPPAPQKPVEDMSAEECEAELEAAEGVEWLPFHSTDRETGEVWHWIVVVLNGERIKQVGHRTREYPRRAAIRALREHQEREE